MKYDLDKDQMPVECTYCDWDGKLCMTDDMDVTESDLEIISSTCVCPRCGHEVKQIEPQRSAS